MKTRRGVPGRAAVLLAYAAAVVDGCHRRRAPHRGAARREIEAVTAGPGAV